MMTKTLVRTVALSIVAGCASPGGEVQAEVTVTADDTVIDKSCRVRIPQGTVIADRNGDGVIHIAASRIRVVFSAGSALRGARADTPWDELEGVGIRIDGHTDVRIENARIHGFKVGLHASSADGLVISNSDVSDNFRQRLRSTPKAEDGADWLRPHNNDRHEWMRNYGAGIYVEKSRRVTIRTVTARRVQNGIILDRVEDSSVYANDCSFLSGWGLALWRSNGNTITRNAFDFCIRGYSHRVYNRGQDSAGILMFEQCSRNVIAENSVTHGGDGLFGHAGSEALGQAKPQTKKPTQNFDYRRRGNNDNVIVANDFSYAAAHGLEMTFCFGNRIFGNRFAENAICGIWGGYSQDTEIDHNEFTGNGEFGYGLERGGVNIEHGAGNEIHHNTFVSNKCGVHLWDDDDRGLMETPWAKANHRGCVDNRVVFNTFDKDEVALHLRDARRTWFADNRAKGVKKVVDATKDAEPITKDTGTKEWKSPTWESLGKTRPRGAREKLWGRDKIIMDEWGPWDHSRPMLRFAGIVDGVHVYSVFGVSGPITTKLKGPSDEALRVVQRPSPDGRSARIEVHCSKSGIHPYALAVDAEGLSERVRRAMLSIRWQVQVFPWTIDPRKDLQGWLGEAGKSALTTTAGSLHLEYGMGGPRDVGLSDAIRERGPGSNHFGTIARAKLKLPRGKYRVVTRSDDGIRVTILGQRIIDNWTHHGPTTDTGEFRVDDGKELDILVQHFEIDGYALLTFDVSRMQ